MKIKSLFKVHKIRIAIGTIISCILIVLFVWEINNRYFLCFSNGKCFTAWARSGGLMIIPDKYYGVAKPKEYAIALDPWGEVLGVSIYLSNNAKNEFIVATKKSMDNSNGRILVVDSESASDENRSKKIEDNAMRDEAYYYEVATDLVGSVTLSKLHKDALPTVISKYHIFRNSYAPLAIILLVVFLLRRIGCWTSLEQKSTRQKLKAISLFGAYTVAESVLVLILDIVAPPIIYFVIFFLHTFGGMFLDWL